jgi:hypothetical protein
MLQDSSYSDSQSLRAIGQDLEALHVKTFDVEKHDDNYIVWVKNKPSPPDKPPHRKLARTLLESIRLKLQGEPTAQKEDFSAPTASWGNHLRYTPEDLDQLEQKGQARRTEPNRTPDGHSLSQLLRALGGYLSRRTFRLQAISWREEFVSIVYETAQGQRELDNFRLDSIYDLWVHMYLRRTK